MTAVENLDVSVRVNHEGKVDLQFLSLLWSNMWTGRIISVSNDFCLLFGYDAEEITGSSDVGVDGIRLVHRNINTRAAFHKQTHQVRSFFLSEIGEKTSAVTSE